jgi:hypothetical protein
MITLKEYIANISSKNEFLKKYDLDVKDLDFLGSGEFGSAYSTGDGKVLKDTTSIYEYKLSKEIMKYDFKHIVKIYDSIEISEREYLILMEELDITQDIDNMFYDVLEICDEQGYAFFDLSLFDEDEYIEAHGENEELFKFINQLIEVIWETKSLLDDPTKYIDISSDNLGYDNKGTLKAFDIDIYNK